MMFIASLADDENNLPLFDVEKEAVEQSEGEGEDDEEGGMPFFQEGINVNSGVVISNEEGINGEGERKIKMNGEINVEEQPAGFVAQEIRDGDVGMAAEMMQNFAAHIGDGNSQHVVTSVHELEGKIQHSKSEDREPRIEGLEKMGSAENASVGSKNIKAQSKQSKSISKSPMTDFAHFVAEMSTPDHENNKEGNVETKKKRKKGGRKGKEKSSSENSITIGVVNEEARGMIPSLQRSSESSETNRAYVVQRNPPKTGVSLSISCEGG